MKHLGSILLGLAAFAAVFGSSAGPGAGAGEAPAVSASPPVRPSPATAAAAVLPGGDAIVIARDGSGQFHVVASVDGTPTQFLVDTGADTVALTEADAQRAGVSVDPSGFGPIVRTASGEGQGARVRLERLELGTTEVRDVDAVVVRDLPVSLLGQSVLGRLGRVELQGDRMVLEPAR